MKDSRLHSEFVRSLQTSAFFLFCHIAMPLFLYLDRQSFVHRRHPLVKVLALFLFFVAAFVVDHPLFILPISVGICTLTLLSGSTSNLSRLRLLFFFIFVFPIFVVFSCQCNIKSQLQALFCMLNCRHERQSLFWEKLESVSRCGLTVLLFTTSTA